MSKKIDEFEIGRGRKSNLDNFSLKRYWQKGYGTDRFSERYISDCYSNAPQAVFKVISFGRGKSQLRNLLEYVNTRDSNFVEFHSSDGVSLNGKDDIDEIVDEWSSSFRKKGSGRGEQRHFTHMILSADVENTEANCERVLASADEVARNEFGLKGFDEYTLTLHRDTNNPHVHIVLNNYNSRTKKKLRMDRLDFLRIRSKFADELTNNGLKKHIATLRRDRPGVLHKVEETISKFEGQKENLFKTLDQCSFMNRKNQLNAQLTKTPNNSKQIDYLNAKLSFEHTGKSLKISIDQKGKELNSILHKLCIEVVDSKKYGLARDGSASAFIKDVDITPELQKLLEKRFSRIIKKKDHQQQISKIITGSKNTARQYHYLIKNIDNEIRKIKQNKVLLGYQKKEKTKELRDLRVSIVNNYDIKDIEKASLLKKSNSTIEMIKELNNISKKLEIGDYHSKDRIKELGSRLKKLDQMDSVKKDQKYYDFRNIKINFAKSKNGELVVYLNKSKNKTYNKLLVKLASDVIKSKNYSIQSKSVSSIVIKDKGNISDDYKKLIIKRFNKILLRENSLQTIKQKTRKELSFAEKKLTAKEFLSRKIGLENYIGTQQKQLKEIETRFKNMGDKEIVKLIKGMRSAKTYNKLLQQNNNIKENIIKNR